ncbi:hypothetical protein B0A48_15349 [Cryoendolithus antarcticus]|uniref:FAD-binding FR-type domain-containing protein n=1 Tax=Cryoendolithus antarcticus TaxID=1507870 RepID=A0A1V8SHW5_9PEZI|nr:hypothetical protein B0A48_15349 [Cryoendolithus antarcticus]
MRPQALRPLQDFLRSSEYVRASRSCQRFISKAPRRSLQQPRYEPPKPPPKDAKGNDPRLARFAKVFGIFIGISIAFAYRAVKGTKGESKTSVSADGFVKYHLVGREQVSSTSSIFTLRVAGTTGLDIDADALQRAITSVQLKQPQLQIARSYTLLPPLPDQRASDIRLLIRREEGGEVSNYLHRLPLAAEIEVRGPSTEYVLPQNVERVIFLAGGTGIVPALQVVKVVAGEADVHVLWANRRREDCQDGVSDTVKPTITWTSTLLSIVSPFGGSITPTQPREIAATTTPSPIVTHLQDLKASGAGRVAVDYFVDDEDTRMTLKDATKLVRGSFSTATNTNDRKILFVSGPEGFVKHWAGPKVWHNGVEVQGPLGGILATANLDGWEVVKL